jgi:hypothetical protein
MGCTGRVYGVHKSGLWGALVSSLWTLLAKRFFVSSCHLFLINFVCSHNENFVQASEHDGR